MKAVSLKVYGKAQNPLPLVLKKKVFLCVFILKNEAFLYLGSVRLYVCKTMANKLKNIPTNDYTQNYPISRLHLVVEMLGNSTK